MPASPPAIFTPPSAGSPPAAPAAVFTPPMAGGPPAAPGAVFAPPSAGSPPGSPAEVFTGPSAAGTQEIRIQLGTFGTFSTPPYNQFYMSWDGQAEITITMGSLAAAGGVMLTASLADEIAANEAVTDRFTVAAEGTEIVLTSTAGPVENFSFTERADPPNAITVEDVSEEIPALASPAAVFTPPSAGSPPSPPAAVFTPPSAGSPPSSPAAVFTPILDGGDPDDPPAVFTPIPDGGPPSNPPPIFGIHEDAVLAESGDEIPTETGSGYVAEES